MSNIKKSLQALKEDLRYKQTTLKVIQNHYPHLGHLSEKEILDYLHLTSIDQLNEHIQEMTKNGPTVKYSTDHSTFCTCVDSKGKPKELYLTQDIAEHQADELRLYQKQKLKVYPCPDTHGWHLTKG